MESKTAATSHQEKPDGVGPGVILQQFILLLLLTTTSLWSGTLSGTILQPDDQPVEGAVITLLDHQFLCLAAGTSTDASGLYSIENLPDGQYFLHVTGPNLLPRYFGNDNGRTLETASLVTVTGQTIQNVVVQPGGQIKGSVTITGGIPQHATIYAVDAYSLFAFSGNGNPRAAQTQLNQDGTYTLSGLESGCYLIGLGYDPNGAELASPSAYYQNSLKALHANQVSIVAGETLAGIDIHLNPAKLGTLKISLNIDNLTTKPHLTLVDGDGMVHSAKLKLQGPTFLLLPPEDYKLNIRFSQGFADLNPEGTFTIQKSRTTEAILDPDPGGAIEGTIHYDPATQMGWSGEIQLLTPEGAVLRKTTLNTFSESGSYPYRLDGLSPGEYYVRVQPVSFFALPPGGTTFQREYYPEATSRAQAQALTISGTSTLTGIDLSFQEGGRLQGTLTQNDLPVNITSVITVTAIETQTREVHETFFEPGGSYSLEGLPPGSYKVGINTGFREDATLNGARQSMDLFCNNAAPSFYSGTDSFESATAVPVEAGATVENIHIPMRRGTSVSGRVLGLDCLCSAQFGYVAAFSGETLVGLGALINGQYEIEGLPPGDYDLRLVIPGFLDLAPDAPLKPLGNYSLDTLFEIFPSFNYPSAVTVSTEQGINLPDWCISKQPFGDGTGSGAGGGQGETYQLLYAWVSNRQQQFESILIANNYSDEDISVGLTARRGNGETQTIQRNIPARGFLKEFASTLFDVLGDGAGYSVLLTAPTDKIRGRWVTNNLTSASGQSPSQGVAVLLPKDGETGQRFGKDLLYGYLPITNGFLSAPVVVNMGTQTTMVSLNFYNPAGTLVGTTQQELQPFQPFATAANNLVTSGQNVAMTVHSDTEIITGVSFVFNGLGETAIGNVTSVAASQPDMGEKTLLYPWVSNREASFESVLIANNLSDETITAVLTARREGGMSETVTRDLPPMGFLQEQASQLFPGLGSGSGYTVELIADSSKVQGQWVTNNLQAQSGNSPSQGIAVDLSDLATPSERVGQDMLFGFLPVTNTFTSAPVIVNVGNLPTDITLRYYNQNGSQVFQDTTTLTSISPKEPFARVANGLLPPNTGDVYMIASSNGEPITGVVFVFNAEFEPAIGNATSINFLP